MAAKTASKVLGGDNVTAFVSMHGCRTFCFWRSYIQKALGCFSTVGTYSSTEALMFAL